MDSEGMDTAESSKIDEDDLNSEMDTNQSVSLEGPDTAGNVTKPLSSEQMTSEASNRLVFGNAEGGNIAAKKHKGKHKHSTTSVDNKKTLSGKREHSTASSGETMTLSAKRKTPFQPVCDIDSNSVRSSDSDIEPVLKLAKVDDDVDKDDTLVASENENYDVMPISGPSGADSNQSPWLGLPSHLQLSADDDSDARDVQSPTDEFNILDDIDDDEEAGDDDDDQSNDDLDDDEIYAWLDEGIEKKATQPTSIAEDGAEYVSLEKTVLIERGLNHFDVLPENWVSVNQNSGMPIYFHRPTRVCTLSKPYFLGPASVRNHDIPVTSIPCFNYRREKEKERASRDNSSNNQPIAQEPLDPNSNGEPFNNREPISNGKPKDNGEPTSNGDLTNKLPGDKDKQEFGLSIEFPVPKLTSAETAVQESSITPDQLFKYCDGLFDFRNFTVKKFKNWKAKRKHFKKEKRVSRPGLASDTRLITCPIKTDNNSVMNLKSMKKKEFVFNPNGKTPLCVLHEYSQHVLKSQPTYTFAETDNAETPYSATVMIGGIAYCTGQASSKRLAKAEAAKLTLEVLIPSLPDTMQWDTNQSKVAREQLQAQNSDFSFFDTMSVDDPRVTELCNRTALPRPLQVLHVCLERNFGLGDTKINIDRKVLPNQKTEYTMTVGKHTVTVVAKNKKDGKQMASQAMLKALHSHITNWGSMLRLYSKTTILGFKERDKEPVTETHYQQSEKNQMNTVVIEKLKDAMRKVKVMRENVVSRGTLKLPAASLQRSVRPIDL